MYIGLCVCVMVTQINIQYTRRKKMIFRFETEVKHNDTVLRAFIKPQENPKT